MDVEESWNSGKRRLETKKKQKKDDKESNVIIPFVCSSSRLLNLLLLLLFQPSWKMQWLKLTCKSPKNPGRVWRPSWIRQKSKASFEKKKNILEHPDESGLKPIRKRRRRRQWMNEKRKRRRTRERGGGGGVMQHNFPRSTLFFCFRTAEICRNEHYSRHCAD